MRNALILLFVLPLLWACGSSTEEINGFPGSFIRNKSSVYIEAVKYDSKWGDLPAIGTRVYMFKDVSLHKYDLDYSVEGKLTDKKTGKEFELIGEGVQDYGYIEFENIPRGKYTFSAYYNRASSLYTNGVSLNTKNSNHTKLMMTR